MESKQGIRFTMKKNWWLYLLYPEKAICLKKKESSVIIGDITDDCHVNLADYTLFIPKYGTSDQNCDFNRNGTVDMGDYTLLVSNYGK